MGFLNALPIVGQLIDKIIPDPEKRLELKLELEKIDLQRDIAGLEAAKAMLSNQHWFVSGAIPSLIWLASVMLATNCVLIPIAQFIGQLNGVVVAIPQIQYPGEYWYLLGVIITGLFAKKSADKGLQLGNFRTATNVTQQETGPGQDKRPDWL